MHPFTAFRGAAVAARITAWGRIEKPQGESFLICRHGKQIKAKALTFKHLPYLTQAWSVDMPSGGFHGTCPSEIREPPDLGYDPWHDRH